MLLEKAFEAVRFALIRSLESDHRSCDKFSLEESCDGDISRECVDEDMCVPLRHRLHLQLIRNRKISSSIKRKAVRHRRLISQARTSSSSSTDELMENETLSPTYDGSTLMSLPDLRSLEISLSTRVSYEKGNLLLTGGEVYWDAKDKMLEQYLDEQSNMNEYLRVRDENLIRETEGPPTNYAIRIFNRIPGSKLFRKSLEKYRVREQQEDESDEYIKSCEINHFLTSIDDSTKLVLYKKLKRELDSLDIQTERPEDHDFFDILQDLCVTFIKFFFTLLRILLPLAIRLYGKFRNNEMFIFNQNNLNKFLIFVEGTLREVESSLKLEPNYESSCGYIPHKNLSLLSMLSYMISYIGPGAPSFRKATKDRNREGERYNEEKSASFRCTKPTSERLSLWEVTKTFADQF